MMPSRSRARSRSVRSLRLIPGRPSIRSGNRRGPRVSSRAIRRGHRSPATWGGRVAAALARERDGVTYANLAQHRAKAADIRDSQLGPALDLEPDLVAMIGGGNDLFAEEFDIAPVKAAIDDIVVALTHIG